jgi:hypothetical protein
MVVELVQAHEKRESNSKAAKGNKTNKLLLNREFPVCGRLDMGGPLAKFEWL